MGKLDRIALGAMAAVPNSRWKNVVLEGQRIFSMYIEKNIFFKFNKFY